MNSSNNQWRGYTLDELRVKRIINETKIELDQARLKHFTEQYTSKVSAKPTSILSKAFGALDYIDYGIIVFRVARRMMSIFGRRKR